MKKKPLISVGILNYNGLKYLRKTLPPILRLDYPNYEIVIVDNGSTDGSVEYIRKFKEIRLIENKKNYGPVMGKNKVVELCNGEFILLIDDDIYIKKSNLLSSFLTFYHKDKKTAFMGILFNDIGSTNTKYYGVYYNSVYGINLHKKELPVNKLKKLEIIQTASFHGGCCFFKKKVFTVLDGFDKIQPTMMDDAEIGIRAILQGYRNYIYTKDCLIHLGKAKDGENIYFSKKFRYHLSGVMITYLKNFSFKNLITKIFIFMLISPFIYILIAIKKKNLYVLKETFNSYYFLIKKLPKILKQRKKIQQKRTVAKDLFLKIKPPKLTNEP